MTTTIDIQKKELELRQLQQIILSATNLKAKEEITKMIKQLDFDQETAIMNVLEKTDKSYDSIVQENFDLLMNDGIEFNVIREEVEIFNSHAIKLDGKILDDEFFYCHTNEIDSSIINFYPFSYVGLINYFGEADIYMDKKKYTFFNDRVPRRFIGSINANGGLSLDATESFWGNSKKMYVNKVSADLFSGDSKKRKKFLKNKLDLKKRIIGFRDNLN